MDVAAFNGPDRFDTAQVRLSRSKGLKALAVAEEPFHGGVIAFDPNVPPLSVYMSDAVEMRVIAMSDFADDAPVAMGLVRANGDGSVQAHTLDCLV